MKKFTIIVLLIALVAAAHFTRPQDPKKNFADFLAAKMTQSDNGVVAEKWDEFQARQYADSCTYEDNFLWVSAKKDGKTVYTGAFAHWFNRDEIKKDLHRLEDKAQADVDQLKKTGDQVQNLANKLPASDR